MDKKIVLAKLEEIEMLANEWDDPQLDDFMGMVNLHHILNKTKYIQRELDSKIVMPEVFDDFAKKFDLTIQQGEQSLDEALNEIHMMYMHGGSKFNDLEDYMRSHGDEEFYTKCVDALVNGYEVEHG